MRPGIPVPVTVAFHPQEDVYREGGKLRLVISSTNGAATAGLRRGDNRRRP